MKKDTVASSLLWTLGLEAVAAAVLWGVLAAATACGAQGLSLGDHRHWLAAVFVPPVLLLRYYVKKQYLVATKTAIVVLFLSVVSFFLFVF